jgi:two-component system, chemotaxis family, CheB/CheR fusion protein
VAFGFDGNDPCASGPHAAFSWGVRTAQYQKRAGAVRAFPDMLLLGRAGKKGAVVANENNEPEPANETNDKLPVIVAIGASAGGVHALVTLFTALPNDTGAAYVVVVHLDPEHRSELVHIIAARTRMPVVEIATRQHLEPNHVYVIPPDRRLQMVDHEISALEFDEPRGHRSPIDLFLRSLVEKLGDGFALILSGAGSDGALGVRAVKEAGGIILVQDPDEAEYASMPRSAIAMGVADFVLPTRDLAKRLVDLIRIKEGTSALDICKFDEELLRRILGHLRVRTGHDFSKYKRSTVLRRIARGMQVTHANDLKEYYEVMRDSTDEAQGLLGDLLISVTTFFRDPEAFEKIAKDIIPVLFASKEPEETIRVWVSGCATGEEAYTFAILLMEEAAKHEHHPPIQVFGSDLDSRALASAREGRYPLAIEADVSEERLRRFFTREGDHYRIRQELRDIVLFSVHDLLKDPPFSHVDLISCRNVLIYLDRELQEQVTSTFHYALNPGGYVFLGASETAESPPGLFRSLDRTARIYQSTAVAGEKPRLLPRLLGPVRMRDQVIQLSRAMSPTVALGEAAMHRRAIEQVAPPSMLIDESHRVIHLSENAGRFLMPSGGPLSGDAVDLVRPELRFELRSALNRVFELRETTLSLPILVRFNGKPHRVHLLVKPVIGADSAESRNAVAIFLEGEAVDEKLASLDRQTSDETVLRLTQELELTQNRLRTVREESDAANEELRAANEELQSINEEYRSTSEELETSKEELQSINEELQTVNSELKLKLETISRAHSDLQNLVAATDVGTLFLDTSLRIKRFTEPVTDLFSITQMDEGRPITDFAHRLEYDDLIKDARNVLADLAPLRREVRGRSGHWYDMRLRPYRTVEDKIDGVVITFLDISELRSGEARQRLLLSELTHRVRNILAVIQAIARHTLRPDQTNKELIDRFEGRLAALASAHTLLVESEWKGADLGELAQQQLAAYRPRPPDRLRIEGEPVLLPADLATPFGLVLHELATNAAKHGALSNRTGKVAVTWGISRGNNTRTLRFDWKETGGPALREPAPAGFGSTLIESAIPGARVKREFRGDGLEVTVEVPLPEPAQNGAAGRT